VDLAVDGLTIAIAAAMTATARNRWPPAGEPTASAVHFASVDLFADFHARAALQVEVNDSAVLDVLADLLARRAAGRAVALIAAQLSPVTAGIGACGTSYRLWR